MRKNIVLMFVVLFFSFFGGTVCFAEDVQYVVKKGDTFCDIAYKFRAQTCLEEFKRANRAKLRFKGNFNLIFPGQVFSIPDSKKTVKPQKHAVRQIIKKNISAASISQAKKSSAEATAKLSVTAEWKTSILERISAIKKLVIEKIVRYISAKSQPFFSVAISFFVFLLLLVFLFEYAVRFRSKRRKINFFKREIFTNRGNKLSYDFKQENSACVIVGTKKPSESEGEFEGMFRSKKRVKNENEGIANGKAFVGFVDKNGMKNYDSICVIGRDEFCHTDLPNLLALAVFIAEVYGDGYEECTTFDFPEDMEILAATCGFGKADFRRMDLPQRKYLDTLIRSELNCATQSTNGVKLA